jgi:hypothetical protein
MLQKGSNDDVPLVDFEIKSTGGIGDEHLCLNADFANEYIGVTHIIVFFLSFVFLKEVVFYFPHIANLVPFSPKFLFSLEEPILNIL